MTIPFRGPPHLPRLGKLPPKIDSRTLRLSRYVAHLPAPPAAVDHFARVAIWPMFLNDVYGICGPAGAAHQIQSWSTYAERGTTTLPDVAVKNAYFRITGGSDTGVYIIDMLKYWNHYGIGLDFIEAYAQLQSGSRDEHSLAMYYFGSVGIGLALPDVGTFGPWDRVYGAPNQHNGHYVCGVGYDADGLWVVTWGELVRMSWEFLAKYNDESWAIFNDLSLLEATMRSPESFDRAQLEADLFLLSDPITPPGDLPPTPGPGCLARLVGKGWLW